MDEGSQHVPSNYNVGFLATAEEVSINGSDEGDEGAESDFSLDYEYLGPRKPNYRDEQDADSDASELSVSSSSTTECFQQRGQGFDMWDEDPYSTNDFTWESNDMRLTGFIKERQKDLMKINSIAPWSKSASFWRKEKGWPKQLPSSCSTTNHDQSASALSLVLSDYGLSEKLHAVYRDRIVDCGNTINTNTNDMNDSDSAYISTETKNPLCNTKNHITTIDHDETTINNGVPIQQQQPSSSSKTFNETHAAISLPKSVKKQEQLENDTSLNVNNSSNNFISKFIPYTKYIRRSQFPVIFPQDAYLALGFEPLCLAEKYGYMAIGGVEGEFELYCCMNPSKPVKIWGTKFKGKNNVLLMTNAVHIVRWKTSSNNDDNQEEIEGNQQYEYFLIACMNDAGVLVYNLPNHNQCHATTASCHLYCHLKCFDHVPINDARVSPDGQHLICVGDDACIFHLSVLFDEQKHRLVFGIPQKFEIPFTILLSSSDSLTFSSQYVAWSKSSLLFAHTSDTHRTVLVWRTSPRIEMLYRIDAGGYTYAIQFHPEIEGVLAFSNRYGYIHTVNLDEAITMGNPKCQFRVADFGKQITNNNNNLCVQNCHRDSISPIHHTLHILARHEITMVSFRGEKNRRLRILAKINGLQWSRDGCYLYVSTKKRVLAYEFMHSSSHVKSLEKLAGLKALSLLEKEHQRQTSIPSAPTFSSLKRQKKAHSSSWISAEKKRRKLWSDKWSAIPAHVRHNVLRDTQLASHW